VVVIEVNVGPAGSREEFGERPDPVGGPGIDNNEPAHLREVNLPDPINLDRVKGGDKLPHFFFL